MGTGTAAMGNKNSGVNHIMCRRCGKRTYHKSHKVCSSCGFGKTAKLRRYNWNKKIAA